MSLVKTGAFLDKTGHSFLIDFIYLGIGRLDKFSSFSLSSRNQLVNSLAYDLLDFKKFPCQYSWHARLCH
jgi:hypothetical protein